MRYLDLMLLLGLHLNKIDLRITIDCLHIAYFRFVKNISSNKESRTLFSMRAWCILSRLLQAELNRELLILESLHFSSEFLSTKLVR
jgi:hypothetical protein